MTVESQNYNIVPARIWDNRLKGFRPMTEGEKKLLALVRANGNRDVLRAMKPITEKIQ